MSAESRGDLPEWQGGDTAGANGEPSQKAPNSDRRALIGAVASLLIGLAVVIGVVFFALSGGDPIGDAPPSEEGDRDNTATTTGEEAEADADGASTTTVAPEVEGTEVEGTEVEGTAVRAAENTGGGDDYGHWIGRTLMTASSVELAWSPIDGDEVSYRIHRFDRVAGFQPDTASFADGVVVYEGVATDVIDDQVESERFYTYVLDATVDGVVLPRRWTEALTVDDTEPPSAITGLEAEVTSDGVVLSWDQSSDNVEFASYSVSLVAEDNTDELTYIGGGADLEQTSFLDNRPPTGSVTYAVMAVDFHDNRTEPATVTVVVP